MRALIAAVLFIVFLTSCSSDEPLADPSPIANGSVLDDPLNSSIEDPLGSDADDPEPAASGTDMPVPLNASVNLTANASDPMNDSDPWIIGADEAGDPLIVEPRARLNESFLGLVPSDDPTPRIVSFTLINAGVHRPINGYENLTGRVLIDRARVPHRLAVRANYAGDVGSVLFSFEDDENHRVENAPPFALHGVSEFGVYVPWMPVVGRYDLNATAYDGPNGIGSHREPVSLTLEFYSEGYLDRVPNP